MLPYLEKLEGIITRTLLGLMPAVVLLATIELAWILVQKENTDSDLEGKR